MYEITATESQKMETNGHPDATKKLENIKRRMDSAFLY